MARYISISVLVVSAVVLGAVNGLTAGFFKIGEPAPNFSLTSLAGETVGLENFSNQVVVLGLFHICEPCLIQGTNLQKVYEKTRGKNVSVIGVNSSGDPKNDVMEFLQTFPIKVTYPYLLDPDKTTDKLYGGGKFIPNVYVIDQDGVIRWQRVGNFFTDGKLAGYEIILEEVDKLLSSPQKPASL
jgi:cytochrome c biogenesis protein CcmG/thiol:disulfide interchange protein DsbE